GNATVEFNEVRSTESCSGNYLIERISTASNACGNQSVNTQIISVENNTAPNFVGDLPSDTYASCDAIPEAANIVATANCSEVSIVLNEYEEDGECDNQYNLIREWVATDECGNSSTHVQIIHITCAIKEDNIRNAVNVDGTYDNYFKIDGIDCFQDNTVKIFNRWGVEVYSVSGYNNADKAFRGFSNGRSTVKEGQGLPTGNYFYVIEYRFSIDGVSDKILNQSGFLYI